MMPSEDRGEDQVANPEAVGILQQGVVRWNEWRKTKDGPSLDLSGADLRNRDLNGADLRGVNLSGAVLRGAKFGPGSLLWNANLAGADLYGANLRGADLQDVNFSDADLFQADLRESNLQGADLSTAKGGLLSKQLAGSDLTGAQLPEPLAKLYDSLGSVKDISDNAQKIFLALLAGCLYSWLTIAQTTDVELITNRASSPLPIIQAVIPIRAFYVISPLIILCIYFYFHFYLQKLWEELGSLPAIFPDGRLLHNRTDPWLLNDLVRSHFARLKDGRPFLSYFQAWISILLAWWLVPITLCLFWMNYLRKHDRIGGTLHSLLLALAIFSAVRLYRIAGETLRGHERAVFRIKDLLKRRSTYLRAAFAIALATSLITISDRQITQGISDLNIVGADVSLKPSNWTEKKDEELDYVKGANLVESDLRFAVADGAFLVKAHMRHADLDQISAVTADLRQANLTDANLGRADLRGARLQNATLLSARLPGARLDYADLKGADLHSADLSHACLDGADMSGASLIDANLTDASFNKTTVRYAVFRRSSGLTPKMMKASRDWQLAFYDPDMLGQLGLPPDHNETLQKQMEAEQKSKIASAAEAEVPTAPKAKP
jgi:uncharacterized protein YjbI with pentapeptide repeats